jgi:hypothetical protein
MNYGKDVNDIGGLFLDGKTEDSVDGYKRSSWILFSEISNDQNLTPVKCLPSAFARMITMH